MHISLATDCLPGEIEREKDRKIDTEREREREIERRSNEWRRDREEEKRD